MMPRGLDMKLTLVFEVVLLLCSGVLVSDWHQVAFDDPGHMVMLHIVSTRALRASI
jgi:hypothetical protein